ncbi:hypothetical protein AcV7_005536 [Taiwanofungus camphoratus]|nr:hypothetical protein AcV7_005536 [Antrodia cinnamomea]
MSVLCIDGPAQFLVPVGLSKVSSSLNYDLWTRAVCSAIWIARAYLLHVFVRLKGAMVLANPEDNGLVLGTSSLHLRMTFVHDNNHLGRRLVVNSAFLIRTAHE